MRFSHKIKKGILNTPMLSTYLKFMVKVLNLQNVN